MCMKLNVGVIDRIFRFVAALVLFDLAAGGAVTGFWNILSWVVAIVLLITAIAGRCPLYALFGINSHSHKKVTH